MGPLKQLALLAIFATAVYAIPDRDSHGKAIGIFNVVKFPNDVCNSDSTSMNGTCYTAEECSSRSGVASGSCAEGYGVCCIITLTCGGSTNENCTYLQQTSTTTPASDSGNARQCSYTICPLSTSVTRIRLELTAFSLAGPTTALPANDGTALGSSGTGNSLGSCNTDTFSVANSPIICGENAGQHMIVDTDGTACVTALFSYGLDSVARAYTIHVIQYGETNEMGGPAGCLQFFTGNTGTVRTFNYGAGGAASTHLANQNYDVCVRPLIDRCVICWSPTTTGVIDAAIAANNMLGSFGLNAGASANGMPFSGVGPFDAATGTGCPGGMAAGDSDDHIIIQSGVIQGAVGDPAPGSNAVAGGALNTQVIGAASIGSDKFCGRFLNTDVTATTDGTVCSRVVPFTLGVRFDGFEAVMAAGTDGAMGMESIQETSATTDGGAATTPLGTTGFSLGFAQIAC